MKTPAKIVVLDDYAMNPGNMDYSRLREAGSLTVYERTGQSEAASRIGQADIVLTNKVQIHAGILDACPSVRYVGVLATGYNIVDVAECTRRGITVTNVPAYSTHAVAQTVFALLSEYTTHVALHDAAVKKGKWCTCGGFFFTETPLVEMAGRTLGIFGFGATGQKVAQIAQAYGMHVAAYSRNAGKIDAFNRRYAGSDADIEPVEACVSLDALLQQSDFVSLHAPLTDDTREIVNDATLNRMKKGAVLINTARGQLIDEKAVRAALESGRLAAYCADVAAEEPMRPDSPLLGAPNCLLTPHIAWAHDLSRIRLFNGAIDNVLAFLAGKPQNCVN